ncbi:MAG: hypothetical protein AAF563_07955 [Pseudomonadota bacterium]
MTHRSIAATILSAFALVACASEQPYEPPPVNYWVTASSVDVASACLVPAMDGSLEGKMHYELPLLPGEYAEVRPDNAKVMGGGDLYYVSVRRHTAGSTVELHGYGEASDVLRPVIEGCV